MVRYNVPNLSCWGNSGNHTMIKTVLVFIARKLISMGLSILWNHVDKNQDGKISKTEIEGLVKELNKLKKHLR